MAEPIDVGNTWKARLPSTSRKVLQRYMNRTRILETASRLRNASVGADGIKFYDGGAVYFTDSPDDTTPGAIYADFSEGVAGTHILRIFAPYESGGDAEANTFSLQGDNGAGGATPGNIWLYSDGSIQLITQDGITPDGSVVISTPVLGLYNLPTTSNPANLHLGTVGGAWTVALVTSSEKYKAHITPAVIDPQEVLQLTPKTWVDKADMDASGSLVPKTPTLPDAVTADTEMVAFVPPIQVGFVAEDLEALSSLKQFVQHNSDGEPEAIAYDRLVVPVLELCKAQQQQIDTLTERLDQLESTVKLLKKGQIK